MFAASRFAAISVAEAPADTQVLFRRAIVLGGSVAGLMAARVLSDHADEVLIIDRDDLAALSIPDDLIATDPVTAIGPRPGVPQGSQVHALLPSGQIQLERWFPGFNEEALKAGAVNPPPDTNRFYMDGELRDEPPTGPPAQALISSRPFLEAMIRHRVLERANVRTVKGRAEGLLWGGEAVTGVSFVPDGSTEVVEERADFVVDATGRSSRLSDWLPPP